MSKKFDERVTFAIKNLWINPWEGDGEEAKRQLEAATAEGDGDAYYFLSRCYFGPQFVNPIFGFEENDELAYEYLNRSLEAGSAVGMFTAMRVAGFTPRTGSLVNPPYQSLQEIWNAVQEMADNGEAFCQYLLGNAYYFGDVIKFFGLSDDQVTLKYLKGNMSKAVELYEKCLANGIPMCLPNLIDIISSGDYGFPKNEKRAKELRHIGADMHVGYYEAEVGKEYEASDPQKALEYYERAAEHGEPAGYYNIGQLYTYGGKLPQNLMEAKEAFEKCLAQNPKHLGSMNRLGEILFYGSPEIPANYDLAFQYFSKTRPETNWCSDMLGTCYLKGLGTAVDYEKARMEFEISPNKKLSAIGLGEIYCYGLGVPQDIKFGMIYFNEFPKDPRVIENKANFKRTLFGWKSAR